MAIIRVRIGTLISTLQVCKNRDRTQHVRCRKTGSGAIGHLSQDYDPTTSATYYAVELINTWSMTNPREAAWGTPHSLSDTEEVAWGILTV